jgi:hypothetical protein
MGTSGRSVYQADLLAQSFIFRDRDVAVSLLRF